MEETGKFTCKERQMISFLGCLHFVFEHCSDFGVFFLPPLQVDPLKGQSDKVWDGLLHIREDFSSSVDVTWRWGEGEGELKMVRE